MFIRSTSKLVLSHGIKWEKLFDLDPFTAQKSATLNIRKMACNSILLAFFFFDDGGGEESFR